MTRKISGLLLLSALSAHPRLAEPPDALSAYRDANYKVAIPLLKTALAADPQNALFHAALLSSLTYEGLVEEASDEGDAAKAAFPDSPAVLTARGEFAYYMADMDAAQKAFRAAIKQQADFPRAVLGLARLYQAASFFRTARTFFLRAHDVDPGDALITYYWLDFVPDEKRDAYLTFIKTHPWLYTNFEQEVDSAKQLTAALKQRKPFELNGTPSEVNLRLIDLRNGPLRYRGEALEMSVNGGRKLTLMVDTGATGILLPQSLIDKLGLTHLGVNEGYGIGDAGARKGFVSLADTCEIGPLKFNTCVFRALEGKHLIRDEIDGLIGPNVFADYLIAFDFQRRNLNLKPFPPREKLPQGYDREIPPGEANFTPLFRWGNHLFVNTLMNGQAQGLFLLDTGAGLSSVDSTFAALSVKLQRDETLHVSGISGEVKKVYRADTADLVFAGFKQDNLDMPAFNLNNSGGHPEFRMSGILGLPLLALFHLTIDYRNGLVHFERAFK